MAVARELLREVAEVRGPVVVKTAITVVVRELLREVAAAHRPVAVKAAVAAVVRELFRGVAAAHGCVQYLQWPRRIIVPALVALGKQV